MLEAFGCICNISTRYISKTTTKQAVYQLQATVQKLSTQVKKNTIQQSTRRVPAIYTTVAGQGIPAQQNCITSRVTFTKSVLVQYKQEIIAVRGTETAVQKNRIYKKLIKQLNIIEIARKAAAIYQLLSKDLVITIEDKQACNSWLVDTK